MSLEKSLCKYIFPLLFSGLTFLNGDNNLYSSKLEKEYFIPSYKRNLENVFIKSSPNLIIQKELIENLPKYSNILFFIDEKYRKESFNFFDSIDFSKAKATLNYYNSEAYFENLWAQDLYENLVTNKQNKILIPFTSFSSYYFKKFLELNKLNYEESLIYFEGGNFNYDFFNGKNIVFLGGFDLTKDYGKNFDLESDSIIKKYKKMTKADIVLVLGKNQEKTPIFHLDQSFVLLDSGEVALLNLDYISEDYLKMISGLNDVNFINRDLNPCLEQEVFSDLSSEEILKKSFQYSKDILKEMDLTFKNLGYKVHYFYPNLYQFFNFQSYINSVPFIDKETHEKKILMPTYDYPREDSLAKNFFEDLGFKVIPVKNESWFFQGNINCLINSF